MNNNAKNAQRHCVLSLIIPVYNEEKILMQQALKLIKYVQKLTNDFEILFVENGSVDKTLQILIELQRRFSFIKILRLDRADYSTAVIEGLKRAKGEYTIVFGIDYVDLEVLGRCFSALHFSDIVICSKNKGFDGRPILNRLINRFYNFLAKLFFRISYSDVEGYHGYNTKKVQALISDVKTKAHLCNMWILVKAKKMDLRVEEVPLFVYERRPSRFKTLSRLPYLTTISLVEFIKIKNKGY